MFFKRKSESSGLTPAESRFFEVLAREGWKDATEIEDLTKRIGNPGQTLSSIWSNVDRLRQISNSALIQIALRDSQGTQDRVQEGWNLLSHFYQKHQIELTKRRITMFAYGSIIFNDPNKFDYDLLCASLRDHTSWASRQIHHGNLLSRRQSWNDELSVPWSRIGTPGHISYLSINQMEKNIQLGNIKDEEIPNVYLQFVSATILLTAVPIGESLDHQTMINRVSTLINKSRVLSAIAADILDEAIQIRQSRKPGRMSFM